MNIIKDTLKSIGYILLGAVSLVVVVGMFIWEVFKLFGKVIAWMINAKIEEKYGKTDQ